MALPAKKLDTYQTAKPKRRAGPVIPTSTIVDLAKYRREKEMQRQFHQAQRQDALGTTDLRPEEDEPGIDQSSLPETPATIAEKKIPTLSPDINSNRLNEADIAKKNIQGATMENTPNAGLTGGTGGNTGAMPQPEQALERDADQNKNQPPAQADVPQENQGQENESEKSDNSIKQPEELTAQQNEQAAATAMQSTALNSPQSGSQNQPTSQESNNTQAAAEQSKTELENGTSRPQTPKKSKDDDSAIDNVRGLLQKKQSIGLIGNIIFGFFFVTAVLLDLLIWVTADFSSIFEWILDLAFGCIVALGMFIITLDPIKSFFGRRGLVNLTQTILTMLPAINLIPFHVLSIAVLYFDFQYDILGKINIFNKLKGE